MADDSLNYPTRPKILRDSVHGDIRLTARELRLLDTPEVQRLRTIRQLGTSHLVYPGATHTRFEHSIGTCWMAKRIIAALAEAGTPLPDEDAEAVSMAALLHDVTHLPFGHTIEDERLLLARHDADDTRWNVLVRDSRVGEVLDELGQKERVLEILTPGDPLSKRAPYLAQIISHTICADLLDYLKRDNLYCGLSQSYDDRIFRYFHLENDRLVLQLFKGGLFRNDAFSEVINLLRIRYFLTERVYFHHAKVASGVLVARIIESAVRRGLRWDELQHLGDESLLFLIEQRYGRVPEIGRLLAAYRCRALPKKAYVLSARCGERARRRLVQRYHHNRRRQRERAERELAAELGLEPWEVSIYCPPQDMQLKEADVLVRVDPGPLRHLASLGHQEVQALQERYRNLWRFYVFVAADKRHLLTKAGKACEEFFGRPNERGAAPAGQLEMFEQR